MRTAALQFLSCLLTATLLAACDGKPTSILKSLPTVPPTQPPTQPPTLVATTPYPPCEVDNPAVPIPISPLNHWIVEDLDSLTLTWEYPEACIPDSYNVEITTNLQFDGSPLNENTGIPVTSWHPTQPLEDCTRYYWRVVVVKDGQPGGQASRVFTFRVNLTGSCAPEVNGSIQGTIWEDQCVGPGAGTPMPDPLPLGCAYTPANTLFTNQSYDPGEPGIPGVVVSLGIGACPSTLFRDVPSWQDGMFDFYMVGPGIYCVSVDTGYAWNSFLLPGNWTFPIEAMGTNTIASQTVNVSSGQELTNVNFGWWYKYGTAWGSTDATVFGRVWHDECIYTPGDPVPDPMSKGCTIDQYGNVQADGILQADEQGIPGVTVDIGPGDCPSSGLATALTDLNGYYYFSGLTAGKYCLRIDPDHGSPNEAILLPGHWTVIPSGHEGMTFRAITLTSNHTLPSQDFGWDFDNLPMAYTPTPLPPLTFTPNINAYCRFGADPSFPSTDIAMKGTAYLLDGRNLDSSWFRIMISAQRGCWVPAGAGSPSGDLTNLRFLAEIPTFTPTMVPSMTPTWVVDCSLYTDEKSCELEPACKWTEPATTRGFCENK
jgi:hypothetical protein